MYAKHLYSPTESFTFRSIKKETEVSMSQSYVSNDARIIDLYKYCQTPWILNAKPGDQIHIITDTKTGRL
jgi:hypothetical protein